MRLKSMQFLQSCLNIASQFYFPYYSNPQHTRMHQFTLAFNIFAAFPTSKPSFKQRQNASTCFLAFTLFSAFPTSKPLFKQRQIASTCFLAFTLFYADPTSKYRFLKRQNAPVYIPLALIFFSAYPIQEHRSKQRQNAPSIVLDLKDSQQFQLTKQRQNARVCHITFKISLQRQECRFKQIQNGKCNVLVSKPFPIYCFKQRQNPQCSAHIKNDLKSCFLQKFREKVLISLHHVPKTKHQTRVDSVILTMVFIGYRNRVHIFGRDRNDDRKGQCPTIKLKPYLDQLSSLETAVCQCVKF